jgi:hypothetical protein
MVVIILLSYLSWSVTLPSYALPIVGLACNLLWVLYTPPPVANGTNSNWAKRTNSGTTF